MLAPHYSLLLKVDPDNYPKLKPDIAESWSVSPDGLTYTFKIRAGVAFHDGSPLTSKDVKATFDRIRNPPDGIVSIRKELFADIAAIEAPDPTTVVMRIKEPDASFLDTLALPYNCIYSAARLAEDANFPAKTVMGSGPFVFVEHRNGSHWIGKRFDKYWEKGKPYLDGFRAVFIKSQAVVTALQGGQIQAEFRSISPGERNQLVNALKDKITVQEAPWVCKVDLLFNTEAKPFDNPKVRQALSMAIDRWGGSDALSKITILKPVGGPLLPGSPLALSNDELAAAAGLRPRCREIARAGQGAAGRGRRRQPQVQARQPQRQSSLHAARRVRDRPVAAHRRDGRASAARRVAAEGHHRQRRVPGRARCLLRRQRRCQAPAAALSLQEPLAAQHDAQRQSPSSMPSTTSSRARPTRRSARHWRARCSAW